MKVEEKGVGRFFFFFGLNFKVYVIIKFLLYRLHKICIEDGVFVFSRVYCILG